MTRHGMLDIVLAWFSASIVTYVLASVAHSQMVLMGIESLGVPILMEDRLRMTFGDIAGLYAYGLVTMPGLSIRLLARWPCSPCWCR